MSGGAEQPPSSPYGDSKWMNTARGWVLPFKNGDAHYEFNQNNTVIFLHNSPYEQLDHIFVVLDWREEDDVCQGMFVWRDSADFFDELVGDMVTKDFEARFMEEPDLSDLAKYDEKTGRGEEVRELIAQVAMANFDDEWAYWGQEGWLG